MRECFLNARSHSLEHIDTGWEGLTGEVGLRGQIRV